MAVGTVSSLTNENWQLISTTTPTVTSSVSISVPSGYKTIMMTWSGVQFGSGAEDTAITVNSNTSNYSGGGYGYINSAGSRTRIRITGNPYQDQNMDGCVTVSNINIAVPKIFLGNANMAGTQNYQINGTWNDESTVTSIQMTSNGGTVTYKAVGTIKLYGIAG